MPQMSAFQRSVATILRDEYHATDIRLGHGSKHRRLHFNIDGKDMNFPISLKPGDFRVMENVKSDIRHRLGPPRPSPDRPKRTLDDLMEEAMPSPSNIRPPDAALPIPPPKPVPVTVNPGPAPAIKTPGQKIRAILEDASAAELAAEAAKPTPVVASRPPPPQVPISVPAREFTVWVWRSSSAKILEFGISHEDVEAIGWSEPSMRFDIRQVSASDCWELWASDFAMKPINDGNKRWRVRSRRRSDWAGSPFGSSPAKGVFEDGRLKVDLPVRIPLRTIKPFPAPSDHINTPELPMALSVVNTSPVASSISGAVPEPPPRPAANLASAYMADDLLALAEMVRAAEAATPYRLSRVPQPDGSEKWMWIAPPIG